MKIAMVVRAMPSHRLGGLELHTRDLCAELARRGHEVHIFTTARAPGTAEAHLDPPGSTIHHAPAGRPGDYSPGFWRELPGMFARVGGFASFDVVHSQEYAGLFLAPRNCPHVVTVHGTMTTEVPLDRRYRRHLPWSELLQQGRRHASRLALIPAFSRMLQRADALIVDSEFTRREVLRINPSAAPRMHVVPLGLAPERYPDAPAVAAAREYPQQFSPQRPLRVALLGRVQEQKGLAVVLAVARMFAATPASDGGAAVRLCVGGTGDFLPVMEAARAQSPSLAQVLELRGRVPAESLGAFFAEADVFLFPDLTQPAFGLVALEAMLHGLPVIGARSGAIPEVVTPTCGWIYDGWQGGELLGLLRELTQRPDAIAEKSRHALAFAAAPAQAAARMATDVEGVYQSLHERHQRTACAAKS